MYAFFFFLRERERERGGLRSRLLERMPDGSIDSIKSVSEILKRNKRVFSISPTIQISSFPRVIPFAMAAVTACQVAFSRKTVVSSSKAGNKAKICKAEVTSLVILARVLARVGCMQVLENVKAWYRERTDARASPFSQIVFQRPDLLNQSKPVV